MPATPPRTALESLEQVYVADRAAWRRWLAANHATSPGIWLVFDKKSSRADRLAYVDAVEEALCYGWIDSTVRRLDETRYVQLMAPRKPKSTWAATNKARVERLIAQGLMTAAGLATIERAKGNGSWESLDTVEALAVPEDLAKALRALPGATKNFDAFAPSARKGYLHWISRAVRPETRATRVAQVAQLSAAKIKARHLAPGAGSAATRGAARTAATPAKVSRTKPKAEKTSRVAKTAKTAKSTTRAKAAKRRAR